LRRIGEGGMGIVYEAEHIVIEKHVALKVLRDDFSARPDVVERFRQEAKSASRIGHENIVDISDFGETESGASYFVMEMLDGEDLADILSREGTISPARAVKILIQCCKALGAAHNKGIVHRDMKPENIFLIKRAELADFVKIVDFGIAKMSDIETVGAPGRKLTKTGMIFGTPEYMSPEQAAGKPLDHRVDIYALGVILYEVLTGRVPFVGDTFMGVLTQHMFEPIPLLRDVNPHVKVPAELEAVILKALAKDPDHRYQTMDELGRSLAAAMDLSTPFQIEGGTLMGYGDAVKTKARGPRVILPESAREAELPSSGGRGKGVLIASAAVVLLGAGAATAWFASRDPAGTRADGDGDRAGLATGEADAGYDAGANTPVGFALDAGGGTVVTPDAVDLGSAASDDITVRITTRPAGAMVTVDERGTVCEQTPCSFVTPRGAMIMLRARKGRAVATRALTPTADVDLELVLAGGGGARPGGGGAGGGSGGGGELKIPDWTKVHRSDVRGR